MLGIGRTLTYHLLSEGRLSFVKVGGQRLLVWLSSSSFRSQWLGSTPATFHPQLQERSERR
ncbi:MAG: hypothetical protein GY926_08340 [bacterium]|nr:hypothetical protein [bacterium]